MAIETKLLVMCLVLLAVALVYAVLKMTGTWYGHHISRHDLIVESKRRRFAYLKALADRDRELAQAQAAEAQQSVLIEDEEVEPALAA